MEVFVVNDQAAQGFADGEKAAGQLLPVTAEQLGGDRMLGPAVIPSHSFVAPGGVRAERIVGIADQEQKPGLRIQPAQERRMIGQTAGLP